MRKKIIFCFCVFLLNAAFSYSQTIRYVKETSAGAGDGSDWDNASDDLQAMINASVAGDEVYVAAGTYRPNRRADNLSVITLGDRDNAFVLPAGIKVYGGYDPASTGTGGTQDYTTHVTVLSGDLLNNDTPFDFTIDRDDNAYHVVILPGTSLTDDGRMLNGFTIRGGNAKGTGNITVSTYNISRNSGGGIIASGAIGSSGSPLYSLTVQDNSADNGGGISLQNGAGMRSDDIIVSNNEAASLGGGIHIIGGSTAEYWNSEVRYNRSNLDGGGIYSSSNLTLDEDTEVSNNTAGGNGGGVYISSSPLTMNYAVVNDNTAGNNGGGIYNVNNTTPTQASIRNSEILRNTATNGSGGGMYNSSSSPVIDRSTRIENNGSGISGGGMYNLNSNSTGYTLTITRSSSISNNTAGVSGGGVYNKNSHITTSSTVAINNNFVTNGYGGGMYNEDSNPTIKETTINENEVTTGNGGGMYNLNSNPSISTTNINTNKAPAGNGGGMYNLNSNPIITASTQINNNRVSGSGGGIYYTESSGTVTSAQVQGNRIKEGNGGGIYIANSSAPTITNTTINSNHIIEIADFGSGGGIGKGGGVYIDNSNPTITGTTTNAAISSNTIKEGDGGGIYITNSSAPTITNVRVNSNQITASGNGGGVYIENANPSITGTTTNATISSNTIQAGDGAGIYITGSTLTNPISGLTINSNTIQTGNGAGVYITGSTPTLTQLTINSNTANTGNGGGVYLGNSSPILDRIFIRGNSALGSAAGNGGGVYSTESDNYKLFNVLISGNVSANNGGGIYNIGTSTASAPVFTNVTISGNRATTLSGGGVYNDSQTALQILNSIVWGNLAPAVTDDKEFYGSNITFDYSLIGSYPANGTNLSVPPRFTTFTDAAGGATTAGTFTLQTNSFAINKGNNSYISTYLLDLANATRIQNSIIDLGAYERADPVEKVTFIKEGGSGAGTGLNWDNAFDDIQQTINASLPGDKIYVAEGTYYSTSNPDATNTDPRDKSFVLKNGVVVTGGFDDLITGTTTTGNDWLTNPTILSADFTGDDTGDLDNSSRDNNAYHTLVVVGDIGADARLDGFHIVGGNADGTGSLIVNGENISRANGGGVYISDTTKPDALVNIAVESNRTTGVAGGIYNDASSFISYAFVRGNKATGNGGGIYNTSSLTLTNALISGNNSEGDGGGVYHASSASSDNYYTNVTIAGNEAANGGGFNSASTNDANFRNSIIRGNTATANDDISGAATYTNSVAGGTIDPAFVAPITLTPSTGGNYLLQPYSVGQGAGSVAVFDAAATPDLSAITTDIIGNSRFTSSTVDMGAYQHTYNPWVGGTSGVETEWTTGANWARGISLTNGSILAFRDDALDNLEVDGTYQVTDWYNRTTERLIINAGGSLTVQGSIIQVPDNTDHLYIRAENRSLGLPNGTFIFPQTHTIKATVEMDSKALTADGQTDSYYFDWQFFGPPVKALSSAQYNLFFVREYREHDPVYWLWLQYPTAMSPFKGYEISRRAENRPDGIVNISGELVNEDETLSLTYTSPTTNDYNGKHVISNPYTAALDIQNGLDFGSTLEETVYLFHTGSSAQWEGHLTDEGTAPGQYLAVPQNLAGNGFPAAISSMQGFVVASASATLAGTAGSIDFKYVAGTTKNTDLMRTQGTNSGDDFTYTIATLSAEDGDLDKAWLFSIPGATRSFDNGWDGRKLIANPNRALLSVKEEDGEYQVSSVEQINDTYLNFKAQEGVGSYTLTFNHVNLEEFYSDVFLVDLETDKITNITADGSAYSFTATNTESAVRRFNILTFTQNDDPGKDTSTGISVIRQGSKNLVNNRSDLNARIIIFNLSGKKLSESTIESGSSNIIDTHLHAGVYLVSIKTEKDEFTEKIIVE